MSNIKVWFMESRPQFLTLSVVLAFLGASIAWFDEYFSLGHALMAGIGLVLAHASVNIFKQCLAGIDAATIVAIVTAVVPLWTRSMTAPEALPPP